MFYYILTFDFDIIWSFWLFGSLKDYFLAGVIFITVFGFNHIAQKNFWAFFNYNFCFYLKLGSFGAQITIWESRWGSKISFGLLGLLMKMYNYYILCSFNSDFSYNLILGSFCLFGTLMDYLWAGVSFKNCFVVCS